MNLDPILREKHFLFLLGSHKHRGMGYIIIRMPVNDISFLIMHADVVDIELPSFLVLDLLTSAKFILYFSVDELWSRCDNWIMSLIRHHEND